jgi:hypothetical protein
MKTLQDKLQEDFCLKAITYYTTAKSGCINVSQRVGKIKISLLILNKLFKKSPKILISYPDNTIKDSWIKDMVKWGYTNPNITFTNRGMLNKNSLRALTKGEDVLPSTYKDLLKSKENNWLQKAPAKNVVMEMRGSLGLKMEDIKNATPEKFETWRQEIIKKMYNQALERWKNESAGPLKGLNAYNQIINRTGSRNKNGGFVSAKLTKKEIDQYIKGGYIIEDE